MNNLVIMKNQQAVTSSLQISESFQKRHDHLLRDIGQLQKDLPNFGEMFVEASDSDAYGRARKIYYMNREEKIINIAKAFDSPVSTVKLTAKYLTEHQLDMWLDRAAERLADQIIALITED